MVEKLVLHEKERFINGDLFKEGFVCMRCRLMDVCCMKLVEGLRKRFMAIRG